MEIFFDMFFPVRHRLCLSRKYYYRLLPNNFHLIFFITFFFSKSFFVQMKPSLQVKASHGFNPAKLHSKVDKQTSKLTKQSSMMDKLLSKIAKKLLEVAKANPKLSKMRSHDRQSHF